MWPPKIVYLWDKAQTHTHLCRPAAPWGGCAEGCIVSIPGGGSGWLTAQPPAAGSSSLSRGSWAGAPGGTPPFPPEPLCSIRGETGTGRGKEKWEMMGNGMILEGMSKLYYIHTLICIYTWKITMGIKMLFWDDTYGVKMRMGMLYCFDMCTWVWQWEWRYHFTLIRTWGMKT